MGERELSLEEILRNFRGQKHVKDKLLDKELEDIWKKKYSNMAMYTGKLQFRKGKLLVWISSSPLKQELSYNKEKIISQLNEMLKENLIQEIEFR